MERLNLGYLKIFYMLQVYRKYKLTNINIVLVLKTTTKNFRYKIETPENTVPTSIFWTIFFHWFRQGVQN